MSSDQQRKSCFSPNGHSLRHITTERPFEPLPIIDWGVLCKRISLFQQTSWSGNRHLADRHSHTRCGTAVSSLSYAQDLDIFRTAPINQFIQSSSYWVLLGRRDCRKCSDKFDRWFFQGRCRWMKVRWIELEGQEKGSLILHMRCSPGRLKIMEVMVRITICLAFQDIRRIMRIRRC